MLLNKIVKNKLSYQKCYSINFLNCTFVQLINLPWQIKSLIAMMILCKAAKSDTSNSFLSLVAICLSSSLKISVPTPTAITTIPSRFASSASAIVSLGLVDRPSVTITMTLGALDRPCVRKYSLILFIPLAVLVPTFGCFKFLVRIVSKVFGLNGVKGMVWPISVLYTMTLAWIVSGPISRLFIRLAAKFFSLMNPRSLMLSEPSSKIPMSAGTLQIRPTDSLC